MRAATVAVLAVQFSLVWLLLPAAEAEAEAAADIELELLGFLGWRTDPHCASSIRHVAKFL